MQNIEELRKSLTTNYEAMKAKEMGLAEGKELSNCADKIMKSVIVELKYQTLLGLKNKIKFLE